jgi:hypothetical protein
VISGSCRHVVPQSLKAHLARFSWALEICNVFGFVFCSTGVACPHPVTADLQDSRTHPMHIHTYKVLGQRARWTCQRGSTIFCTPTSTVTKLPGSTSKCRASALFAAVWFWFALQCDLARVFRRKPYWCEAWPGKGLHHYGDNDSA